MEKILSQQLAILGEKIEWQRIKSETVLEHAQAALAYSQAARQHFLDIKQELQHQQGFRQDSRGRLNHNQTPSKSFW